MCTHVAVCLYVNHVCRDSAIKSGKEGSFRAMLDAKYDIKCELTT